MAIKAQAPILPVASSAAAPRCEGQLVRASVMVDVRIGEPWNVGLRA